MNVPHTESAGDSIRSCGLEWKYDVDVRRLQAAHAGDFICNGDSIGNTTRLRRRHGVWSAMSMWCEVSECATHRSSPHSPCEPSARLTGRARTYATDLPKRDSTSPEAASERDQCFPHHPHRLPRHLTSLLYHRHQDTTVPHELGLSIPSYNTTSLRTQCSPHHTDCVRHYSAYSDRIRPVPSRGVWSSSPFFTVPG
jgi:hypothetical protein